MEWLLKCGPLSLELRPGAGGTVAALRRDGHDLLRPSPTPDRGPLQSAAFPLVPYAGRIREGRFRFDGREFALPANLPPEPHAIHGVGWTHPWTGRRTGDHRAVLELAYAPHGATPGWPWPFLARQVFELDPAGLSLELSVRNAGTTSMPAGLGWHPYFPADGAWLAVDAPRRWPPGPEGVPTEAVTLTEPFRAAEPHRVSALRLDDVLDWPTRCAGLRWPDADLALELRGDAVLDRLVVYTPERGEHFCVEPVSHVPDAVNLPFPAEDTGLTILAPGATLRGSLRLEVTHG